MIRCTSCVYQVLRQIGRCLYGVKIAVMGLAYKKSIYDPRPLAVKNIETPVCCGFNVMVSISTVPCTSAKM